jgi:hypothetical protein
MAVKYVPIPNGRKIYKMAVEFSNVVHCNTLENFPKSGIFGLKKYHLATLERILVFFPGFFRPLHLRRSDENLSTAAPSFGSRDEPNFQNLFKDSKLRVARWYILK